MKRVLALSVIAVSIFAADLQVGVGYGRAYLRNFDAKKYNFANFRMSTHLDNKKNLLRLELEKSTNYDFSISKNNFTRALLNIEHDFCKDSKFTPYVFIGGGYQWVSDDKYNALLADAGLGAKYKIYKNLSFFVEAKETRDYGIYKNNYAFLGGLSYDFGGKSALKNENVTSQPQNIEKPKKIEKPKIIDSDNDGVPDNIDKCPNTPKGVKVDKNGCPLDSDKDGVPDYLDKCPNTPKGMKVDKNGCAISFNFDITFDTNSAKIKPEFMPRIKKFAKFLKSHPDIKAEIQGYTDNTGKYAYNMVLSQKRAKAVYKTLLKLGINKDQLTWAGYGPNNPIASNNTPVGRAKNRRVVAKLIY